MKNVMNDGFIYFSFDYSDWNIEQRQKLHELWLMGGHHWMRVSSHFICRILSSLCPCEYCNNAGRGHHWNSRVISLEHLRLWEMLNFITKLTAGISFVIYVKNISNINEIKIIFFNLVACNLGSLVTWGIQYHLKLRHNVLPIEDRKNTWTSDGFAVLSYSFWFVVGAAIIHILNIVLIFLGAHQTRRDRHKMHKPIQEEKTNGAIMLYWEFTYLL